MVLQNCVARAPASIETSFKSMAKATKGLGECKLKVVCQLLSPSWQDALRRHQLSTDRFCVTRPYTRVIGRKMLLCLAKYPDYLANVPHAYMNILLTYLTTSSPPLQSMIKEAILAHPQEARTGLSRPTIKKFIQQKHSVTSKIPEASFNNHISKAIAKGAEKKIFSLPKGPSGKVKLAAPAKKPAAVKKPAAAKKPAAKKPAAKKVVKKATTAKKVSSRCA